MITVQNLKKAYDNGESKLLALNDVSFDIGQNEFVVILGASGSGKTTLMNCVSGLERADGGSIYYNNDNICCLNENNLVKFRRDNVAFIFQSYFLLPALSVENNIKMGANLSRNKDFSDIIEKLGLKGLEKRLPYELSGGQQQRVAIARALSKKPKVLFCDEPTGALDEATGRQIIAYLQEIQKRQDIIIVMVTHNENIAKTANKIIKMNSGKIVEIAKNNPVSVNEIIW